MGLCLHPSLGGSVLIQRTLIIIIARMICYTDHTGYFIMSKTIKKCALSSGDSIQDKL